MNHTATACRALVHQHLPLVRSLARRMAPTAYPFLEIGDLVSIGTEALLRASQRYDRSRAASFGTFAYQRVRGAMVEGLGASGPHSRGRRRRRAGRPEPRALPVLCPFDERKHGPGAPGDLGLALADQIDDHRMAAHLEAALAELDERDRELIRRHYFDGEPMQGIARDLGISKSWASRIHARTLARLRGSIEGAMAARSH